MTVPWLENCQHSCDSWCLDCVKKLGQETWDLQEDINKLRAMIFDGGFDISPCKLCGKPIVCIPDGLPVCESCYRKDET